MREYFISWYDINGKHLQDVSNGSMNRAELERDARRQIGENRGMSDAPRGAHHFVVGVL